ncbi:MAG: ArgP/LysG family DNA-binding transcriptional regulator [Micrococcus sp.]|nr:ArgP/LysG family DNA-binding transcriptional regulator [Micrococcus sp.]
MNSDHLRALTAAMEHGTFDAAADALGISGSAFSQRIKALEKQVGQVLLARTVPVTATPAGEHMLRLARQTLALEEEALGALGVGRDGMTPLHVAVNADSLDTWFLGVLQRAATWDSVMLRLHSEDQEHTVALLRSGTVMAAVTATDEPVPGCVAVPLGSMRYYPVVTRDLAERHPAPDGSPDLTRIPVVDYGVRDLLQRATLSRVTAGAPPHHTVPSVTAYRHAVVRGLGWGMLPQFQIPDGVTAGTHPELAVIEELGCVDVPLFWQRWTTGPASLDRLTEAVLAAARAMV